jgi:hypothetical protein
MGGQEHRGRDAPGHDAPDRDQWDDDAQERAFWARDVRDKAEDRRVNRGMAVLFIWYVVLGVTGTLLARALRPDSGVILIAGPIALVTIAVVAPVTLAMLAQNRHRFSSIALGSLSAAAGLVVLAAGMLLALAIRG